MAGRELSTLALRYGHVSAKLSMTSRYRAVAVEFATLTAFASLLFIDPLREWLNRYGVWAWCVAVAVLLGAMAWAGWTRDQQDARRATHAEELEKKDLAHERIVSENAKQHEVELAQIKGQLTAIASELKESRAAHQRDKAELARLLSKPTERDLAAFAAILEEFPRHGELDVYFRESFDGGRWREGHQAALRRLNHVLDRYALFDNEVVGKSRGRLFSASTELLDWMYMNGESTDPYSNTPSTVYRIRDLNMTPDLAGQAQKSLEVTALADELITARENFEQVGRSFGL